MAGLVNSAFVLADNVTTETELPVRSRKFVSVVDLNQGSYSANQIIFQTDSISAASQWVNWKESYLVLPIQIETEVTKALSSVLPTDIPMVAFKESVLSLIHSVEVFVNGTAIQSQTQKHHQHMHWRYLTEFSKDDLEVLAPTIGYVDQTGHVCGLTGATGLVDTTNVVPGMLSVYNTLASNIIDQNRLTSLAHSTIEVNGLKQTVQFNLTIPLTHLAQSIESLPMTRGMLMRIQIATHANNSLQLKLVGATALNAHPAASYQIQTPYGYYPYKLNLQTLTGDADEFLKITSKIGNSMNRQCYLRIAQYDLNAEYEAQYLKQNIRFCKYQDMFTVLSLRNVAAGAMVSNFMVSNGLAHVRSMLIVPKLSKDLNKIDIDLSPVWNGRCLPYGFVSNLQISISGQPLFAAPIQYSYEHFMEQTRLSCGKETNANPLHIFGLKSGLMNQTDFNSTSYMIYVDLSQKHDAEDSIAKSIYITSMVNATKVTVDYEIYVWYDRSFSVDTSVGTLVV